MSREAKRTGLTSLLFAILRPRDACRASVDADTVRLTFGFGLWSTDIPLGDVKAVHVADGCCWSSIRIRHPAGDSHVSGLPRMAASALADALETARREWWRQALTARIGTLRTVHDRVTDLVDPPKYLTTDALRDLEHDAQTAVGGFAARWPKSLSDSREIRMLRGILAFLEAPDDARAKANKAFVANEPVRSRALFDRIEARPLTAEQRKAVVVDERCNLVVAAAGSGKTSVIVAKAGWLLRRGYRRPSELLLLAFARNARKEMEDRIRARLGAATARGVTVRTFHSLGMAIIGKAEGKCPALAPAAENDQARFDLLKGIVADLLADRELSTILREWFQDRFAPYKSEHKFESWGDYYDYIRKFDIRSLKGETVRSFEECEIANFLYLNGVTYEYGAPYEHDLATSGKRRYKPDFHLPDHGIYMEHFGIDAAGRTAPYVDREQYLREMNWKSEVHAAHGTILIETFSHEHADGRLLGNLTEKLAAHGVTLSPIPREKVFDVLKQQGRIDSFTRLAATFLQHFKDSRLSFPDIADRAGAHRDPGRAQAFLTEKLAAHGVTLSPIPREKVFAVLKQQGRIDSFTRLVATFLQHFKGSRLSFPDIAPTGLVPTAGPGAGASVPDREARGPRRDLVANPARESVRRSQRTGPDRFVHALGGDLPAALQGQPAVLPRHRADWAGAHRGTRGGRKRS